MLFRLLIAPSPVLKRLHYPQSLISPAGFAVPVGVPLILAVAGYVVTAEEDEETEDEPEVGESDEDDGKGTKRGE